MPWIYKIAAHTLYQRKQSSLYVVTSDAYSGFPPDVNDPTKCAVSNVGPLPPNGYTIRPAADHPMLGPLAMYLDPSSGGAMYGRGGFFMHGDSLLRPGYASHGCIILPHDVRQQVSDSTDRSLLVQA